MKKRIPAIILMFALFLTTSYAANTYRKTITVTSGVNVEFNNEAIDMTDANGKAVEAFIYNGTTYVPIRAVSNAFGADINYSLLEEELLPLYNEFIPAYRNAVKNYTAMYNQKSYSNMNLWSAFSRSESEANVNGISYSVELESFYDSFNWREFK